LAITGYEFSSFRRAAMEDLTSLAEIMGTASAGAVAFGDTSEANLILDGLRDRPSIVAGELFSANTGMIIASYRRPGNTEPLRLLAEGDRNFIEGGHLKTFRAIRFREDRIGTIYLEADMERAYHRLFRYMGIVLTVIVLLIPLVYLISDRLRRIISGPIEGLAVVAHAIATEKKYSVRAHSFGDDEVGRLTETFNEMLATIEERDLKLVQQAEELWRSNKELEQFAYVSSHDLQEPLRKITTYSQMLEERLKGVMDDESKKYTENIALSVTRMRNLINALLAYSRLDRGDRKLERVDLNQSLKGVLADLEASIIEKRATITHDPLPTVEWNAFQTQQLFQNLIGNAMKFSDKGSPVIHVSCQPQGTHWLLGVHDNGIGIEGKYKEQIFKVFQRLHARHVYPGTGIGLAICKKIVEQGGGKIWVESEPGKGSHFYFTWPMGSQL
jgi:signal transduction histidine kinase